MTEPIRMTRAQYEAKYGTKPVPLETPVQNGNASPSSAPIRMTRAEYQAKYNQPVPTPKKEDGLLTSIAKGVVRPVATNLARPLQAVAGLAGVSNEDIDKVTKSIAGDWIAPTPKNYGDVKKDVGRAVQTVGLGLGPTAGGAALGGGAALEQGKGLGEAALYGAGGALAGRAAERVIPALVSGATKVLPKGVTNAVGNVAGKVGETVGKITNPIEEFAANTQILPKAASNVINRGAGVANRVAEAGADLALNPVAKAINAPIKAVNAALNPDAEMALTKAIKPGKNNKNWTKDVRDSLPYLQETSQTSGKPIRNADDLIDAIGTTKKRVWESFKGLLDPSKNATIDGNVIADAMEKTIDRRFRSQNPRAVESIIEKAKTYRRALSVDEAEEFLQSVNNELNSYYAKSKVSQVVARKDPATGHIVAEAEALRDALYTKLGELTGKDAAQVKKVYGALSNLEKETRGRALVAARQNPNSLQEQLSFAQGLGKIGKSALNMELGDAASGVAQMVGGRYIKNLGTTDSLIERAFQNYAEKPAVSTAVRNFKPKMKVPPMKP